MMAGWIYVFEAAGRWKIGRAGDVKKRLKQIKTSSPFPVRVWCAYMCKSPEWIERDLHELFAGKRITGEWFDLDDNDRLALHNYMHRMGGYIPRHEWRGPPWDKWPEAARRLVASTTPATIPPEPLAKALWLIEHRRKMGDIPPGGLVKSKGR